MVGRLRVIPRRGRMDTQVEYIGPLTVLTVSVPCPEGLSPRRRKRRLRRGERLLVREGARRVLLAEDSVLPSELEFLRPVDPLPFYRGVADVLALGAMEGLGLEPRRGRVALCAPWLCPEVRGAAERLCPQVRELLIDVPREGEDYARWLHRQYGLPVTPAAAGADVTLAFGEGGGRWGRVLELYGSQAKLDGLEVTVPGLELPEDCGDQALALLWEAGAVGRDSLLVREGVPLDSEG